MKDNKFKKFVKDHKRELIVGGAAIVGGVSACLIGKKLGYKLLLVRDTKADVWMPGFTIEGPLTIGDLGKLGEEYMKHDPELTTTTKVLEVGHFVFE